jgi:tetratricopeptide (TPR) repeat protein
MALSLLWLLGGGLASADWEAAVAAFERGEYRTAARAFEDALATNPDAHEVHFMLGRCQLQMGESAAGISSIREALERAPANWQYRLTLGRALLEADRAGDAHSVLGGLDEDAGPESTRTTMALIRAQAAVAAAQPAVAVEILRARLDRDGGSAALHRALGLTLKRMGEHEQAWSALDRAWTLDGTLDEIARIAVQLALSLADQRGEEERTQWLERALAGAERLAAATPSARHLALAGDVARQAALFEAGAGWYRKALQQQPGNAASAFGLGRCLVELERDEEARVAFGMALEVAGDRVLAARVHRELAGICARSIELECAVSHFRLAGDQQRAQELEEIANGLADATKKRDDLTRQIAELEEMTLTLVSLDDREGAAILRQRLATFEAALAAVEDNLREVRLALARL